MSNVDQPIVQGKWTPTPFNLVGGNPFPYSDHAISVISATEAFETGINRRDNKRCVVCDDEQLDRTRPHNSKARVENREPFTSFVWRHNLTLM